MLTIQLDEFDAAEQAGIKPRFTLLDIQQLLAVEALWGRYGYQKPFTAMRVFLEVYEQGVRYEIGVWGATEQKVHLSPAPARKPLWRLVSSGKPRFCRTLSRNGSVR
ncbi:hypothetical protein [Stutzerimonas stutzeri]|uniref:hypothetical protein n=1 Tax=Stutzerimonas stutzeri TaxID=316 RepID=UPI0036D9FCEE